MNLSLAAIMALSAHTHTYTKMIQLTPDLFAVLTHPYQAEKIANIENELSLARQAASKYKVIVRFN